VKRKNDLRLITEGEPLHRSDDQLFEQVCARIGVAEFAERVNW
jgi:hypothetical protein